jgi:hypothetical protein
MKSRSTWNPRTRQTTLGTLRLNAIQNLFNKFFRPGHKFFRDLLDRWIVDPDAKKRLFGVTRTGYTVLAAPDRQTAINDAWDQMQEQYRNIFQRRHDCIHNCDRTKVSPQSLNRAGTVLKVIQDVEFLVPHCDQHIHSEFREFLASLGCTPATITQVGY